MDSLSIQHDAQHEVTQEGTPPYFVPQTAVRVGDVVVFAYTWAADDGPKVGIAAVPLGQTVETVNFGAYVGDVLFHEQQKGVPTSLVFYNPATQQYEPYSEQ